MSCDLRSESFVYVDPRSNTNSFHSHPYIFSPAPACAASAENSVNYQNTQVSEVSIAPSTDFDLPLCLPGNIPNDQNWISHALGRFIARQLIVCFRSGASRLPLMKVRMPDIVAEGMEGSSSIL